MSKKMQAVALGAVLALVAACDGDRKVKPSSGIQKIQKFQKTQKAQKEVAFEELSLPPAPAPPAQPEAAVVEKPLTFAQLMQKAKKQIGDKQTIDAIETYLEAAKLDPKSARPHVEISCQMIRQREAKLARKHAELAVKLEPARSRAWNTLGRVELMEGKLAAAAKAFIEATKRHEKNIYAWNNLGLVRIKQHKYANAVEALEKATAGDKPKAYMFNNLGIALERLDRIDEALVAYKSGLALGSGVAGQNFVRLEKDLDIEETAELDTEASDREKDTEEPSES